MKVLTNKAITMSMIAIAMKAKSATSPPHTANAIMQAVPKTERTNAKT